jgi:hypothetical protein
MRVSWISVDSKRKRRW